MKKKYIATVQIIVEAEDENKAEAIISEEMDDIPELYDWAYLKIFRQELSPAECYVDEISHPACSGKFWDNK